jgi:hypothetical protein
MSSLDEFLMPTGVLPGGTLPILGDWQWADEAELDDEEWLDKDGRDRILEKEAQARRRETERRARLRDRITLPDGFFLARLPAELFAEALSFFDVGELMGLEAAAGPRFFALRLADVHALGFAHRAKRLVSDESELAWIEERRPRLLTVLFKIERRKFFTGFVWLRNGWLHRDSDLPAVEHPNGDREWYVDGKLHRENGLPAIERKNGAREWWQLGRRVV